ncbi:hypothetical protein MRX96_013363 [Rhipicephalus microplus]
MLSRTPGLELRCSHCSSFTTSSDVAAHSTPTKHAPRGQDVSLHHVLAPVSGGKRPRGA